MDTQGDASDKLGYPARKNLAQILNAAQVEDDHGKQSVSEIKKYLNEFMLLAGYSIPSTSTITNILSGKISSYANVNWVITSINVTHGNIIPRSQYMAIGNKLEPKDLDPNLIHCLVFPRLAKLMAQAKISDADLEAHASVTAAEEIAVKGHTMLKDSESKPVAREYVVAMRKGLPARKDKILAVVRALREHYNLDVDFDTDGVP